MYTKFRIITNGLKCRIEKRPPKERCFRSFWKPVWRPVGEAHDDEFDHYEFDSKEDAQHEFDSKEDAQRYIRVQRKRERKQIHDSLILRLFGDTTWRLLDD